MDSNQDLCHRRQVWPETSHFPNQDLTRRSRGALQLVPWSRALRGAIHGREQDLVVVVPPVSNLLCPFLGAAMRRWVSAAAALLCSLACSQRPAVAADARSRGVELTIHNAIGRAVRIEVDSRPD